MMDNPRWIKVSVSYREGEKEDAWDAITLGDTSLLQPIDGASSIDETSEAVGVVIGLAIRELVRRSDRLIPARPTKKVAVADSTADVPV